MNKIYFITPLLLLPNDYKPFYSLIISFLSVPFYFIISKNIFQNCISGFIVNFLINVSLLYLMNSSQNIFLDIYTGVCVAGLFSGIGIIISIPIFLVKKFIIK